MPDVGNSDLIKLHDKLYSNLFAPHLRFDIDFIPHIAVGNSEDVHVSKQRVDRLNARGVSIKGRIENVTVIELNDNIVTPVETYNLT